MYTLVFMVQGVDLSNIATNQADGKQGMYACCITQLR